MLPLLIIAVCAVWVYIDSRRRGIVKSGNSIGQSGPIGWALITLLLWIVGFPWYLIKTRGWKGSAIFVAVASLLFAGPYLVTTWIIPLKGAVESETGRPSPSAPLPSSPRTAQCEPLGVSYNQAMDGLSQFFTMEHTRLYDGRDDYTGYSDHPFATLELTGDKRDLCRAYLNIGLASDTPDEETRLMGTVIAIFFHNVVPGWDPLRAQSWFEDNAPTLMEEHRRLLETNSSHQAEDFKKLLESRREIAIGNRLIQLKAGLGINITVIHKETGAAAGTEQAKLPTSTDLTAPGLPSSSSPVNSAPISQAGPHFPLAKLPHVARIPGENSLWQPFGGDGYADIRTTLNSTPCRASAGCDAGNYRITPLDLNGDGALEFIVSSNECGSGGCEEALLMRIDGKWQPLAEVFGGIEIKDSKTKGFRDVVLSSKSGDYLFKWTGTEYGVER